MIGEIEGIKIYVNDGTYTKYKKTLEDEIWECSKEEYYSCKDGRILLGDLFFNYKIQTFINDEVEIIEEPKKIEKIDEILMIDDLIPPCGENDIKMWKNIIIQQNKINELIDEINNLKEK